MQRMTWAALGSSVAIAIDTPRTQAEIPFEQVPIWLVQWEQLLEQSHPDSEIARLNAAQGQPIRLSGILWSLLRTALDGADLSDGLVLPFRVPTSSKQQSRHIRSQTPDWRAIRLDPFGSSVTLPHEICIDLQYLFHAGAATMLVRKFAAYGPVLVTIDQTIGLSGPMANGNPWQVSIPDSRSGNRQSAQLHVASGSLVTFLQAANDALPLIDPRTAQPAQSDLVSVTVMAPDPIAATVVARTLTVLGSQAAISWLESQPKYAASLLTQNGETITSQRIQRMVI